ncbi:MAG: hypothetical protein F4X57_13870 [Chloroflexi bacterium]|nr:hypothetical protein [Chloroflexota bacterium]
MGERLVDGKYRWLKMRCKTDGRVWSHSEALKLELWWTDGDLRFWDPAVESWLLRREEERAGRMAAEVRAGAAEACVCQRRRNFVHFRVDVQR